MNWYQAIVLTFACTLVAAQAKATGYHATYKLIVGPMTVGKMERSFTLDSSGVYKFESKLQSTGLAALLRKDELYESSRGRFYDDSYHPIEYTYVRKNKKKPRNIHMVFDHENANIKTVYNGDTRLAPLDGQLLDKLVYQAALMHNLSLGRTTVDYRIADRGEEKVYQPIVGESDVVETDYGRFEAIKVVRERQKDQRRTIFWCAPALDYLPVQVTYREKDGKETIAVLTNYVAVGPAEAVAFAGGRFR